MVEQLTLGYRRMEPVNERKSVKLDSVNLRGLNLRQNVNLRLM